VLFLAEGDRPPEAAEWEQADFVFLTKRAFSTVGPSRLDLLVAREQGGDLGTERARALLRRAFDLECPFVYSVSQGVRPEEALERARQAIEEWYWPHEIALDQQPLLRAAGPLGEPGFDPVGAEEHSGELPRLRHLVGWKRIVS
jgi:hypothetical protein